MEEVKTDQGLGADGIGAEQQVFDETAGIKVRGNPQGVGQFPGGRGDVDANRDRPVGELVPRQQITGKA